MPDDPTPLPPKISDLTGLKAFQDRVRRLRIAKPPAIDRFTPPDPAGVLRDDELESSRTMICCSSSERLHGRRRGRIGY
jgi:hypothetical protein